MSSGIFVLKAEWEDDALGSSHPIPFDPHGVDVDQTVVKVGGAGVSMMRTFCAVQHYLHRHFSSTWIHTFR